MSKSSTYEANLNTGQLCESDAGGDVTFLVGEEPDIWCMKGERRALAEANPVLQAMFFGTEAIESSTVVIPDVSPRSYFLLLRFLQKNEVDINSVTTALSTLEVACRYLCPGLLQRCVEFLNNNLHVSCVLDIFIYVRFYSKKSVMNETRSTKGPYDPSAPQSKDVFESAKPGQEECKYSATIQQKDLINIQASLQYMCESLEKNCLEYIDLHADEILIQEQIEDLSLEDLLMIIERNTLRVSSKAIIVRTLARWSNIECRRRSLEPSRKNISSVLGNLQICQPQLTSKEDESVPSYTVTDNLLSHEFTNYNAIHRYSERNNENVEPNCLLDLIVSCFSPFCD